MASTCKLGLLITLLVVVSNASIAISSESDFKRCENTVMKWATAALVDGPQGDKLTLRDLLFFLHIPRTGGRTYFQCFLRKLYTSDQECPRSYDKLRFDPSKPNCKLMVTHDDYSMMTKLPNKKTSVITILRNPLDRVFSTYEFSVEVAARFLVHPNLTSATRMTGRVRSKAQGVSTLDIWPWKYLVPWMREDLFARRGARKLKRVAELKDASDSYNMEDMVMPLHLFINDPVAHEIIHNGATFQVAGLTNNSYLEESIKIRHCVRKHPNLGQYVLHVAKKRLEDMLYVGLTEDHKESATMFANMVGTQVLSMLEALNSRREQASNNRTDLKSPFLVSEPDSPDQLHTIINNGKPSETRPPENNMNTDGNMTVIKLMEAYEVCVSSLRKSQGSRRVGSLKRISPANFSKEARLGVSETVIEEILSLNSLDVELYKHAQDIFAKQRVHLEQKLVKVEKMQLNRWRNNSFESNYPPWKEKMQLNRWRNNSFESNYPPWKVSGLAVAVLLLVASVFLVNSKRRNSKVKV